MCFRVGSSKWGDVYTYRRCPRGIAKVFSWFEDFFPNTLIITDEIRPKHFVQPVLHFRLRFPTWAIFATLLRVYSRTRKQCPSSAPSSKHNQLPARSSIGKRFTSLTHPTGKSCGAQLYHTGHDARPEAIYSTEVYTGCPVEVDW